MTLNISVVGKFHENPSDLCDKNDSVLYQMDEDDPNILPMDSPYAVMLNYMIIYYIHIIHGRYVFFSLIFPTTWHVEAGHISI